MIDQTVLNMRRTSALQEIHSSFNKNLPIGLKRFPGFGKTYTLAIVASEHSKVLYLYPSKEVKNAFEDALVDATGNAYTETVNKGIVSFGNTMAMTYMKLIHLSKKELDKLKNICDLIILDECHMVGAEKTSAAVRELLDGYRGHVVGASATPDRTDGTNVFSDFFGGNIVSDYSLKEAFDENIVTKPTYRFCYTDTNSKLKETALLAGQNLDNPIVKKVYLDTAFKIAKIYSVPSVIKHAMDDSGRSRSYMKFIVFFPSFSSIRERGDEVEGWFRTAFPNHNVRAITVTSEDKFTRANQNKIREMKFAHRHIDLIYCIDMLNHGLHMSDLTGIVMFRATKSSIVYTQQLGRALCAGGKEPCVVIDIVDNIHRKAAYGLFGNGGSKTTDKVRIPNDDADEERDIREVTNVETVSVNGELAEVMDMLSVQATYKELIAKAVAEMIHMNCCRVRNEHKELWRSRFNESYPSDFGKATDPSQGGIPIAPIARKYGVNEEQFRIAWENRDANQCIRMLLNNIGA